MRLEANTPDLSSIKAQIAALVTAREAIEAQHREYDRTVDQADGVDRAVRAGHSTGLWEARNIIQAEIDTLLHLEAEAEHELHKSLGGSDQIHLAV